MPFHAGEPVFGVAGAMLYSRTPITQVRTIGTQFVSFTAVTEVDGEEVTVVVTHPESPMGDGHGWRSDHDALRAAVAHEQPDLLLGDLNATVDHARFRDLLETGLRDAAEVANSGWQPTWPSAGQVHLAGWALPRCSRSTTCWSGDGGRRRAPRWSRSPRRTTPPSSPTWVW